MREKRAVPQTEAEYELLLRDVCESVLAATGSRGVCLVVTDPCWKPAGECAMGIAGRDPSVGPEIAGHLRVASSMLLEHNDKIVHQVPFAATTPLRKD